MTPGKATRRLAKGRFARNPVARAVRRLRPQTVPQATRYRRHARYRQNYASSP